MSGFSGHASRCVLDPAYSIHMEEHGYPPEFCESILPDVVGFQVWIDNKPPAGIVSNVAGKGAKGASPKAPPPQGAGPKAGKATASGKATAGTKAGKASASGKATASQQHGGGGAVKGKASGKRGGRRA